MDISREAVKYCADLSRIELSDSDTDLMIADLTKIVTYFDNLNQLDTEGVEPMSHVFDITNVTRDDIVDPSYNREELLSNAPASNGDSFIVPRAVK